MINLFKRYQNPKYQHFKSSLKTITFQQTNYLMVWIRVAKMSGFTRNRAQNHLFDSEGIMRVWTQACSFNVLEPGGIFISDLGVIYLFRSQEHWIGHTNTHELWDGSLN